MLRTTDQWSPIYKLSARCSAAAAARRFFFQSFSLSSRSLPPISWTAVSGGPSNRFRFVQLTMTLTTRAKILLPEQFSRFDGTLNYHLASESARTVLCPRPCDLREGIVI